MVSEDLAVEVLGSTRAWYKAWVINMFNTNALCTFENGWKDDQRVPFMNIRLPSKCPANYTFRVKEEVEVLSETIPSCWWLATIECISKDRRMFSIVYKNYGHPRDPPQVEPFVRKDRLRPVSENILLNPTTFYKFTKKVPDKMRDCADIPGVLDEKAFQNFQTCTKASLIRYDRETNEIVVLTPHLEVYRDVEKCFDYQLSLLESMADMLYKNKLYAERLQSPPEQVAEPSRNSSSHSTHSTQYREEFTIEPNFMGLAIGTRGKNINLARKIPGIVTLDLDEDKCLFTIVGESREAVCEAREMLEYGEHTIQVDPALAPKIIGRKGFTIQNIVDKSQCVRVRIENPPESEDTGTDMVQFVFVGTFTSLKWVQILMDCQVKHVKDTSALTRQNMQSDRELREKIHQAPRQSVRQGAPLLTPRAPITPPYPCEQQDTPKAAAAVNDRKPISMMQKKDHSTTTLLQTPTVTSTPSVQSVAQPQPVQQPIIERSCIETQTEPIEVLPVKPASKEEVSKPPTALPRAPLQKRTSTSNIARVSPRELSSPREGYRGYAREPVRRTIRDSPKLAPREKSGIAATRPSSRTLGKPLQKPKVDIKLAHEKIGTALSGGTKQVKQAEEVRTEQQAAIEDLVKLEANHTATVTKKTDKTPAAAVEDKENNRISINNLNVKTDNQPKLESGPKFEQNENLSKIDEQQPLVQTVEVLSLSSS